MPNLGGLKLWASFTWKKVRGVGIFREGNENEIVELLSLKLCTFKSGSIFSNLKNQNEPLIEQRCL